MRLRSETENSLAIWKSADMLGPVEFWADTKAE